MAQPAWVNYVLAGVAIVSSVGVLWRFVVRPLLKSAVVMEASLPTIVQIAKDFSNGSSLKSRLDDQDKRLAAIEGTVGSIQKTVERLEQRAV